MPRLCLPLVALALLPAAAWAQSAEPLAPRYERVEVVSSGSRTAVGETIAYPGIGQAEVTAIVVSLLPGEETGWHTHETPVYGYVLEGELTVDYGDAGERLWRTGEGFLEAMAVRHNGRNDGDVPVRVLAVLMGTAAAE